MDISAWKTRANPGRAVESGERVALGFDGSISDDETVVYGCTEDGHLFLVGAWSRPPGAPSTWRIPRDEVNAKVAETFDRFDVGRMYADTPKWREEIGAWVDEYNTRGNERVLALDTYSARRFAPMCDGFVTAIDEGRLSHDGDELLTQALAACARKQARLADDPDDGCSRFVIVKADTRKIDRAVAAVLAYGAATEMPPLVAESRRASGD